MISERKEDYGIYPTKYEADVCRAILAYEQRFHVAEPSLEILRRIIEHCAERNCHDMAEWKNSMMFELTGAEALCRFRDEVSK